MHFSYLTLPNRLPYTTFKINYNFKNIGNKVTFPVQKKVDRRTNYVLPKFNKLFKLYLLFPLIIKLFLRNHVYERSIITVTPKLIFYYSERKCFNFSIKNNLFKKKSILFQEIIFMVTFTFCKMSSRL